ncbi:hypothetical protein EDD99_3871 [Streptomyces sp. 846.5]|nr:hypothetical protein [Streptomyces sp. 846.5]TDU05361.1 hypothetical protein EDD99_3871 [Streptomyces sp. 846.5]
MSELTEPTPTPGPAPAPAPQFDAASVWAVPPDLLPAAPRNRTWLRTALRWTTAVVVCAAVGTGTAFAVMAPRRTDIPGLRTPTDGRYVFPALTLPALPSGAVGPVEGATGTGEGLHAVDLRKLLLPAPAGAQVDTSYPGASGWYPVATFGQKFDYVPTLRTRLQDDGARHVAATGWKGPDGTRTEIFLVQVRSYNTATDLYQLACGTAPDAAPNALVDPEFVLPDIAGGTVYTSRVGDAQSGHPAARITCVQNGDVAAVILMTNPVRVNPVVTEQVATLQAELLLG